MLQQRLRQQYENTKAGWLAIGVPLSSSSIRFPTEALARTPATSERHPAEFACYRDPFASIRLSPPLENSSSPNSCKGACCEDAFMERWL